MSRFDMNLFNIGPGHDEHSNSNAIIKLDESGVIFCPLCLSSSYKKIEEIPNEQFEKYVRNSFEALDQHGERSSVRDVVLSILEIILSKRSICIRSDHDFHNLLRVIYKILNSGKFCLKEFPAITQMFSAITRRFTGTDPVPIVSVSKATETIVDRAGKQLSRCLDESSTSLRLDIIKLLQSVYTTIRAYLELLGRFAISSELFFPLHKNGDPRMHDRKFHKSCQTNCLNFAYKRLFPCTMRHLKTIDRLDNLDGSLVFGLFTTLRESFLSACRVEHNEFIEYIIKEDCLSLAHTFSYKCSDSNLRTAIKSFLEVYVLHYVEAEFGQDSAFMTFKSQPDIIETNHKNAIVYSRERAKSDRTIFYIMVNYVAHNQKSRYYCKDRLKRVLSEVDPSLFFASHSRVIRRVYLYAAAIATKNVLAIENLDNFFERSWKQIRDGVLDNTFDEDFCSYERIFFWAHRHDAFRRLITWRSIKRLVETGLPQVSMTYSLLKLLDDDLFKEHFIKYLENDESSIKVIERLIKTVGDCEIHVEDRFHKPLMTKLGAIIPSVLYDALKKLLDNLDGAESIAKTERLTGMMLLWIDHCKKLPLLLDHDFISKWFEVLDTITSRRLQNDGNFDGLIIIFVQLVCSLIKSNHSQLLEILTSLKYTSLSLMYNLLADHSPGDKLAEKCAEMIVAYDELDYPLEHDAIKSLLELSPNILNWMLSSSKDLHALAVRCASKTFKNERSVTTRVLVATGLIHMLDRNPEVLRIKEHADVMRSIVNEEEVVHNPLFSRVKSLMPTDMIPVINEDPTTHVSPSPSPALSFVSDDSNPLEEENISVMRILTQLQNDESIDGDTSCTIPESLFVSRALVDRHINSVDIEDWERIASEANKIREPSVGN